MAMDFGKNNRSVAFNPTSAFPLDARSYFESYEAAVAAAATAEEAGSSNSVYYFGQTIAVVENEKATLYIIQPNKTLSVIEGSSIEIDPNQFEFKDGKLSLLGFNSASAGQMLIIGPEGKLVWATPIDTYTKTEIDLKIAAAGHLKRKIVEDIKEIEQYIQNNTDYNEYIFMVPNGPQDYDDKYDEYIVIEEFDSDNVSLGEHIEKVGSWEVKLDDYATKEELKDYIIDPKDGSRLITTAEGNKLVALNENAEENYIKDVSTDFTVDSDGKLKLSEIIQSTIGNKVDKTLDSNLLVSASDREILDALIENDGQIEISGTITADRISDLKDWLNRHATLNDVKGLSENNFTTTLSNKLNSLVYLTSVNSEEFDATSGHLSINKISHEKITGLSDLLNQKASLEALSNLTISVSTAADQLNQLSATVGTNTTDISDLKKRLSWQALI